METVTLDVKIRDKGAKARDLREQGLIPAEYYGKGVENKTLQINYQDFRRAYRVAGGNTIVVLSVDGKDKLNVLIHEVQLDPVTDSITHVDFEHIRMDEEIVAKIPIEFVGVAPAVKELGGMLMPHLNEVEVKCLPKDLIHNIEVNIEPLVDFHTSILVSDLMVPDSVKILHNLEDVVVNVIAPRQEEEEPVQEALVEGAEGDAEVAAKKEGEVDESKGDGDKKEE